MNKHELRREIGQRFPGLRFTVRTVSFQDLARGSAVFVESDEWGMTMPETIGTFQAVKAIAAKHGAIASF
jgi:hypothetical protein